MSLNYLDNSRRKQTSLTWQLLLFFIVKQPVSREERFPPHPRKPPPPIPFLFSQCLPLSSLMQSEREDNSHLSITSPPGFQSTVRQWERNFCDSSMWVILTSLHGVSPVGQAHKGFSFPCEHPWISPGQTLDTHRCIVVTLTYKEKALFYSTWGIKQHFLKMTRVLVRFFKELTHQQESRGQWVTIFLVCGIDNYLPLIVFSSFL